MTRERWTRAYREEPALFDEFACAEDPSGRLVRALVEAPGLEGPRVLELGCGTGRLAERLAPSFSSYLALDREPGMLELAARRLVALGSARAIHADARSIPLPDGSVDGIVAAWVLGHLPRRERDEVIAEARRVSRPGAHLFALESAEESEFQALRLEAGGRRDAGLLARLETEGFESLERVETSVEFDSPADAERVLGFLCASEEILRARPRCRIGHAVEVLRLVL